jgi:nitrate reductase alpha subunit
MKFSLLLPIKRWKGSLIDCNIRAERMGWLPSAPQLRKTRLTLVKEAEKLGAILSSYVVDRLKWRSAYVLRRSGSSGNWPRNMFVWRSISGLQRQGHEYFLKHFLGTQHGVQGKDLGAEGKGRSAKSSGMTRRRKGSLILS